MPGTTDIGNHGDDTVTTIALPFPVHACTTRPSPASICPPTAMLSSHNRYGLHQLLPAVDQPQLHHLPILGRSRTDSNSGAQLPGRHCGVFTSVTGTAPNRIFNIEWRAVYFADPTGTANFELRLYEGQTSLRRDLRHSGKRQHSATAGVQRDNTCFAQYFCNGDGGPACRRLDRRSSRYA